LAAMAALARGLVWASRAGSGCYEPGRPADDESTVTLKFNIAAVDPSDGQGSRATEFEDAELVREMIRTLRIIIVHADPTDASRKVVEFNQFWDLAGEAGADDKTAIAASASKEINVYAGTVEKGQDPKEVYDLKDIYVIANEHGLYSGYSHSTFADASDRVLGAIDLSNEAYGSGMHLDDEALKRLERLTFDFRLSDNVNGLIPMAEHHQVKVRHPRTDEQGNIVDREQSVSLFVTRALVKVTVKVTNTTSGSLELTGYRLTNLASTGYLFPVETVYTPAKEECQEENPLKDREITSFEIPAQQLGQMERTFTVKTTADGDNPYALEPIAAGKSVALPSVYMPESQSAEGFSFDISLFDEFRGTPQILKDMDALPRNTHLIINVTIGENSGMTINTVVLPYIGVNLEPGFGI
ncbi:MAG: hypothetical protein K2H99_04030, partial [Paramuribaculum sp.]|nr:hypothetical protein [Paramuribaculum sp.]